MPQLNYAIRNNDGQVSGNLGWLFTILWLHSDNMLRCYPSNELLAKETGQTAPTLTKHRNQLIDMKALIIVPMDKRITENEKALHQRKHVYQITGMMQLPDGKIISTMHFNSPEKIETHLSILQELDFDISPLIEIHESKVKNFKVKENLPLSSTLKDSSSTPKDSLPPESAEDVAPDNPDLLTKKKEDEPPSPEIDWQAKILAALTDDWLAVSFLECALSIPYHTLDPLEFSEHPAAVALYNLESKRIVEYKAKQSSREGSRDWRLHPDGQPAPKSDFDLLKAAIVRRLDINNGALLSMTNMLRGTSAKKDTAYYQEAQFFEGDNACTPDDIDNMADYFIEECGSDALLPRKAATVSDWIARARKAKLTSVYPDHTKWRAAPEPDSQTLRIVNLEDETNDFNI